MIQVFFSLFLKLPNVNNILEDKKPEDWDDREFIVDPEAKKPVSLFWEIIVINR